MFVKGEIDDYLRKGSVQPSESEYASSTMFLDQQHLRFMPRRTVYVYRKLNQDCQTALYWPQLSGLVGNLEAGALNMHLKEWRQGEKT